MAGPEVIFFVFDGFSDWEASYALAGIASPQLQRQPARYRVRTAGLTTAPVTSMGGLRVEPDLSLAEIAADRCAMLILPGGESWDRGGNAAAASLAGHLLAAGVPVAAICGATAGLARHGLLDARRHTSNMPEYLAATGYRGAALYIDSGAVSDGDVITASGIAPVDFAREIFHRLDLYPPAVIDAWFQLFKTGDRQYYAALMQAAAAA